MAKSDIRYIDVAIDPNLPLQQQIEAAILKKYPDHKVEYAPDVVDKPRRFKKRQRQVRRNRKP